MRPRESTTLAALADDAVLGTPVDLGAGTLATLHEQAELQAATRSNGTIATRLVHPTEQGSGFERLPEPSRLDLAIDLEGDPFWRADRDLTFMFGLLSRSGGEWTYRPEWAHDEHEERALVATVIDAIHERLRDDPAMHVYHYGHVEVSVLKRLCMLTRSARTSSTTCCGVTSSSTSRRPSARPMRIGLEGYGLKQVERLPGFVRTAERRTRRRRRARVRVLPRLARRAAPAGDRELQRRGLSLDRRRASSWLRDQAPGDVDVARADDGRPEEVEVAEPSERELLREQLVEGEPEGSERWLAGELLAYHSRAAKQQWWAYFRARR